MYQVNKHNQCADRAIVITDKGIYKLDPKKKYKPLRTIIPFQQVRAGIAVNDLLIIADIKVKFFLRTSS